MRVPKANLVGELNGGWAVAKEPQTRAENDVCIRGMLENPAMELLELADYAIGSDAQGRLNDAELRSDMSQLMRETALGQLGERIYWQGKARQTDPACRL